jgi:hypothetical protein
VPPTRVMCRIWDSCLYLQPADFSMLWDCGSSRLRNEQLAACSCCDASLPLQQTRGTSCAEASSLWLLTAKGWP